VSQTTQTTEAAGFTQKDGSFQEVVSFNRKMVLFASLASSAEKQK
jgi:hypothetical protein